jgi:hypothetical protein
MSGQIHTPWDRGANKSRFPLKRRLCGPQSPFGRFENEKSIAATETWTQECLAPSLVTTVTKISQFQNLLCTAFKTLYHPYCVLYRHWFGDAESLITKKHFKK